MARGRISAKKVKGVKGKAAIKVGKLTAELGAIQELLKAARKLKKPSKVKKVMKKKVDTRKKANKSIAAKKGYRTKWIKKNANVVRHEQYKSKGQLPLVELPSPDEMEQLMIVADNIEAEAGKRDISSQHSSYDTPQKILKVI